MARNSLELQRRVVDDPDLDEKIRVVARVSKQAQESGLPNPWIEVAQQPSYRRSEEGRALVDVLNVFEEIAIGIRRGFYDEDVLYDSIRSIVVKLCCHAMPYIVARDTSAHENVVWLGLRWYVRMRLSDSPDDPTGSARRAWLVGEDWTRWGVHRTTLNPFSVTGAAFLLMAQLGRKLTVIDPKRDLVIRRARLSTLRGELCSVFDAALVEFKERQ